MITYIGALHVTHLVNTNAFMLGGHSNSNQKNAHAQKRAREKEQLEPRLQCSLSARVWASLSPERIKHAHPQKKTSTHTNIPLLYNFAHTIQYERALSRFVVCCVQFCAQPARTNVCKTHPLMITHTMRAHTHPKIARDVVVNGLHVHGGATCICVICYAVSSLRRERIRNNNINSY